MDRLTSLTVFTRVVDNGGFSAAARRLNMSTTMVSNHVQSLEDHLGARLLNRTTRKVSLTEVGRGYYERCVQILGELEEADRAVGAAQNIPSGTLRVYTSTHIVRFIAPVIAEFIGQYPNVLIDLSIGERMVDLVEEGYDLAIRTLPPPDSSLIVRQLAQWRHMLCCSPDYLKTHDEPKTLEDLKAHNCLRYSYYPFGEEWHFIGPDGKEKAIRVTGNVRASSGDTLRIVALEGRGILLSPGFLVGEDIEKGRLIPLLPEYRPVEFAITAAYPHRRHLSAKVRGFLDLLAQRISTHQRWLNPESPHMRNDIGRLA